MADSGIYEIVNLVNGKRYVGSAVDIPQRWREHRTMLRKARHHSRHLQASWNKHGGEAFEFRIILRCAADQLIAEEQAEFDRRKPEYNICPTAGSTLGRPHGPETKAKIAASKVGLKMPPRSAEHCRKLSESQKGRVNSPEHMAALQAARRAKVFDESDRLARSEGMKRAYAEGRHRRDRPAEYREKIASGLRGRVLSDEHRAAVSAGLKGKKQSAESIRKRSEALKGRRPSDRCLAAAAEAKRGKPAHNRGKPISEEQREKQRANMIGRQASAETKAKMSAAHKARWNRLRAAASE